MSLAPSKTNHPLMQRCPSNTLWKNIHAVSLVDLLTVDTILCATVAAGAAGLAVSTIGSVDAVTNTAIYTVAIIIVFALWIIAHVVLEVPSNLAYYFGFGRAPHVFKVCMCFPFDHHKTAAAASAASSAAVAPSPLAAASSTAAPAAVVATTPVATSSTATPSVQSYRVGAPLGSRTQML